MSFLYNGNHLVVHVDGACTDNHDRYGNRNAGYGIWFNHNHPWNEGGLVRGCEATNNNAEIEAAIRALKKCSNAGYNRVEIRTDSQFLVDSVSKWLPTWRSNGWRKSDGNPVQNKVKFMELDAARSGMSVQWVHVPGHRGIPGNEGANKLAQAGARQ